MVVLKVATQDATQAPLIQRRRVGEAGRNSYLLPLQRSMIPTAVPPARSSPRKSGLCGLGFPAIIGCTVVACQELHTLWKKRAITSRSSRSSVLGYLAMSALALLAEATLGLYLYWY